MRTIQRKKTKNISISVSLSSYDAIESFITSKGISRSELVDRALENYLKTKMQEELKNGYIEEREENLKFANDALNITSELWVK